MPRMLLALCAVAALALPGPAHADAPLSAECTADVTADNTPGGVLGGQNEWNGTITAHAVLGVAESGTMSCVLVINAAEQGRVLGPLTGTGVIAGAGRLSFTASAGDDVRFCADLATDVGGRTFTCGQPFVMPPPPPFADCPYGSVTGDIAYAGAGVQATSGPQSWVMTLHADCVGVAPFAGHYDLTITGTSTESCVSGSGSGIVAGTGPNGALAGSWGYTRGSIHYYGFAPTGSGTYTDASGTHSMAWWLDIFPTGVPCPVTSATIVGHGLLV